MPDAIFSAIESLQGNRPWGSVLDAGSGLHSLRWVSGLDTRRWTAVTGERSLAERLEVDRAEVRRPADRILLGNWLDPELLAGEVFEVVLADYLVGALDAYAPYYQDRLFERLRPLVGERLYVVGLEPSPPRAEGSWGSLLLEVERLRDACIRLAGDRCYREYPRDWTRRRLEAAGFVVEAERSFPIRYGLRHVEEQLDVGRRKLARIPDRPLARELKAAASRLRQRAQRLAPRATAFGVDTLVVARPRVQDGPDSAFQVTC